MTTRTEYAVRYTEVAGDSPTIDTVRPYPADHDKAQEVLASVQLWQADSGLPADAEIVTRTVTTTEWEPETAHGFKAGDRVVYTSPRTGKPEAGWEFLGPDATTPATIRKGLVRLKWVGSDRNMIAYGVDPANLVLDTTQTGEEVA